MSMKSVSYTLAATYMAAATGLSGLVGTFAMFSNYDDVYDSMHGDNYVQQTPYRIAENVGGELNGIPGLVDISSTVRHWDFQAGTVNTLYKDNAMFMFVPYSSGTVAVSSQPISDFSDEKRREVRQQLPEDVRAGLPKLGQ